jgi:hypothetical protein
VWRSRQLPGPDRLRVCRGCRQAALLARWELLNADPLLLVRVSEVRTIAAPDPVETVETVETKTVEVEAAENGARFPERYLGEGLFASFDGFSITLRAPRLAGDHFVALDPEILDGFLEFAATVKHLWAAHASGDHAAFARLRADLGWPL